MYGYTITVMFLFSELLIDSLFKPGVKLNPEHKSKYIYLLAYAASVCEVGKKSLNKEELKVTMQAIEKVHTICSTSKGSTELIAELSTLYQCIRFVNAGGLFFSSTFAALLWIRNRTVQFHM